jgi:hypothetical protein
MTTQVLVKNVHTAPSNEQSNLITKSDNDKFYYRLRVNINGFKLEDVRLELVVNNKKFKLQNSKLTLPNQKDKVQVRINARRTTKVNNIESTNEFEKYYDIVTKSNIDLNSMKYYLDPKNSIYLIVEFLSNSNENVYVNLDDSCESLVEAAAKSLLNIRDIEDLKRSLDKNNNKAFEDVFSPTLIREINQATKTRLTPINIIENTDGTKLARINVDVPHSIKSASLFTFKNLVTNSEFDDRLPNHLNVSFEGLKLKLDALTTSENATSTFTKELNLPKGSRLDQLKFDLNKETHSILIEVPISN